MRFGFTLPNNFGIDDATALVDLAVEAEDVGYDSVWVNHHILNIGYVADRLDDRPYHDALTILAVCAARTERVGLGTSVLVLPYLHPMVLAKTLATIDQLSNGRTIPGVGVGSLDEENVAMGVVWERRGIYTNESIEVMKGLWTENDTSFHGEFFDYDALTAAPKPVQQPHPPILIGGNRPPALRRVAKYGNGWHPMMLKPESIKKRLDTLDELLAAEGRTRDEITVSLRIDMSNATPESIAAYDAVGVNEMVVSTSTPDLTEIRSQMQAFAQTLGN